MKIAYTFVISDLFHYGHLQLLEAASNLSDKLICGVLTDEAVLKTGSVPISNYQERSSVIQSIRFVDEIVPQSSQDPFENLCDIRKRFPKDEIIFVYGENWGEVPGQGSLNKINITLKRQSFYKKLSHQHIACKFVEKYYPNFGITNMDTFTERFVIPDVNKFSVKKPNFTVTTKANTLQRLKPLLKHSFIEKMYVFTVSDWEHYQDEVLLDIKETFLSLPIVVRSSMLNEDSLEESKAGHYQSVLNIDSQQLHEVKNAIETVINSYPKEERGLSDQILIQHYTNNVVLSGVVFTSELTTNAPYYIVNYHEGNKTDAVTSGQKSKLIKIFKHIHRRVIAQQWQNLLKAIDELEHIIPNLPLDIEFAIKEDGKIVIFQVRPLSANVDKQVCDDNKIEQALKEASHEYHLKMFNAASWLQGESLLYSDMSFWNPSELIGCHPSPLAYDLFDILFMKKAWWQGLAPLGYSTTHIGGLMDKFGQKPYINVNLIFMALIPSCIADKWHAPLYHFYVSKLKKFPYLHDKVEFSILFTAYDFCISERLQELASFSFTDEAIQEIEQALLSFTKEIILNASTLFENIREKLEALENSRKSLLAAKADKMIIHDLVNTCEELGTIPFTTSARMAFIAEALLRSLKTQGVIQAHEFDEIKKSFCTIAFELTQAMSDVAKGVLPKDDFMKTYGHLRAGTYDITQKRYDQSDKIAFEEKHYEIKQDINEVLIVRLNDYLIRSPLNITFAQFYAYVKSAIELREYSKFVFTKVLSDIIEEIKEQGVKFKFTEQDLSYLTVEECVNLTSHPSFQEKVNQRYEDQALFKKISLPPVVTCQDDFMIFDCFDSRANFVTDKMVSGAIQILQDKTMPCQLKDKIVFIENADPGYHWILSCGLKALVTKYGGVASHMAICCAELGIPAAIGCGDRFDELKLCSSITIDCLNEIIEPA